MRSKTNTNGEQRMSKIAVVQKPDDEVPTEIIASSIRDIAAGMKKINAGALNRHALVLLLRHSSGCSARDVSAVLDSMDRLALTYLKKKP